MKARAYVKRLMRDAGLQVSSRGRLLEGSSSTCLAVLTLRLAQLDMEFYLLLR